MAEIKAPTGVSRIVFKQLLDGDWKKFEAKSNIAQSGGGARDIRFGNWPSMRRALGELFPGRTSLLRKRGGVRQMVELYVGSLCWLEDGNFVTKEALLESPTDARGTEARLARVPDYNCFKFAIPEEGAGRLIALLIQREDGSVWPRVVTERSLEHDDWDSRVSDFLLSALNAKRAKHNAAYGFIDFITGETFVR